ncbi:SseB family protein [Schumannella sp. 10F1B-5-1]|uniref:SseB family protein n=1 Tax=Schumannella sp. 10F1B-5-1 TaxID=2590780 RepID=UPI0011311118|nr:SseB family protein [Schumannella sp. 10F1B-5-1]TPW70273.1 SseB family protein [Schumannella sp. 10F1B-5-1]
MTPHADSAGVPFEGRAFEPNANAGDDGSADPRLLEALQRFRARELGAAEVIEALRPVRLLVPLLVERGDEGVGAHGQLVDKTQELSLVTLAGPDGRPVLPAFTGVAAMSAWNPMARPVPVEARRVAIAAGGEGTDRVVLDPTTPTEFGLRRGQLAALALDAPWVAAHDDPAVTAALEAATAAEPAVLGVRALAGDPDARLTGPELLVAVALADELDEAGRGAVLQRLGARWSADALLSERVDSLAISVVG